MVLDPFTIIMLAVLAVLIFFMFRNSRKRQADARNGLAVHRQHGAGRRLEQHLVLVFVDREDGAEHAEVGHDLRARLDLRLQLTRIGLALARVSEHEEDQDRQDGEHDDGERIERHERRSTFRSAARARSRRC